MAKQALICGEDKSIRLYPVTSVLTRLLFILDVKNDDPFVDGGYMRIKIYEITERGEEKFKNEENVEMRFEVRKGATRQKVYFTHAGQYKLQDRTTNEVNCQDFNRDFIAFVYLSCFFVIIIGLISLVLFIRKKKREKIKVQEKEYLGLELLANKKLDAERKKTINVKKIA